MTDLAKIQKLLNLTSSHSDAEALAALRLAQKQLDRNLGDFLASGEHGFSRAAAEKDSLYDELEQLFEAETGKLEGLKKQLEQKDKMLKKLQRDVSGLKREVRLHEDRAEVFEKTIHQLTEELLRLKDHPY